MPRSAGHAEHVLAAALPLLIPVGLLVALVALIDLDPAHGVTGSRSPFSDEGWGVMNARNLVRLGTWAPDDWHLYLVNLPFSITEAVSFQLLGVGIVQARLVSVLATVATAGILAVGLRGPFGRVPALVAAVAFASSTLVLFYGHLALLEPLVTACLTLGVVLVIRANDAHAGRWGVVAGLALAIAIGTKPNAAFAAVGILAGIALIGIRSDPALRRWLAWSLAAIGACAVAWLAFVGIPNASRVAADIRIWPAQRLPASPRALIGAIGRYPVASDGAIPATAPALLGGAIGVVASFLGWRRLDATGRRLVCAAVGWLVLGFAPLFILSYHPNRYVEPLIPALAILLAAGLSVAWPRLRARVSRPILVVAGATLVAVLAAPGSIAYAGWIAHGSRTLVATQAAFERLVPDGAILEGDFAPLFAMTTRAQAIVPWPHAGVNVGDRYADRGVRWLVASGDEPPPGWVAQHPDAWAGRRSVHCATWDRQDVCLFALP
jgi:hypothetical protein